MAQSSTGIRGRIRRRIKNLVDRLNGDYSAVAPEELEPYKKPGTPQEDVKVVMAKLKRPRAKRD